MSVKTASVPKLFDDIKGCLAAIRYNNNGFVIGKLDSGISVKGHMGVPQVGMEYHLSGRWETHPVYGKSFRFFDYKAIYPTDLKGIRRYLIEQCKWVGPETATRLVTVYGANTLDICKNTPEKVAEHISGITIKRAKEISEMLKGNEANEELQIQIQSIFAGIGISQKTINEIIGKWKKDTVEILRNYPYKLIKEIHGIGFLTADKVAERVGFDKGGYPRLQAGILYLLDMAAIEGHTCLPIDILTDKSSALLNCDKSKISTVIDAMTRDKDVISINEFIYIPKTYQGERFIARKLMDLMAFETIRIEIPDEAYSGLMDDQIVAIKVAINSPVFILTGAPGTGKTYTIKTIIELLDGQNIIMGAPTGKAAKRMRELTGLPALTIHKMLEPKKTKGGFVFGRNTENPLSADAVIIDEVSMVDTWLMASMLSAISTCTRLIMIGDYYQLPAVGAGNVLSDLINSGVIPTVELTEIKRQDAGLIIHNCHKIKNGENILFENSSARDFFCLHRNTEESIKETILDLLLKRLKAGFPDMCIMSDVQVITPLRERTSLSCKNLNADCQSALNMNPFLGKSQFKIGDKVIQTKNDYDRDIFNGDIGYIEKVSENNLWVLFENPERFVVLPLYENKLELAYVITCHKFQGSESKVVIIPIHRSFPPMLMQRNWLYTAISRAKDVCILVGQPSEITKIIRRNEVIKRYTKLAEMLRKTEDE